MRTPQETAHLAALERQVARWRAKHAKLYRKVQKRDARIQTLEQEQRRLVAALKQSELRRSSGPVPLVHHQLQLTIVRARAAEQELRDLKAGLARTGVQCG